MRISTRNTLLFTKTTGNIVFKMKNIVISISKLITLGFPHSLQCFFQTELLLLCPPKRLIGMSSDKVLFRQSALTFVTSRRGGMILFLRTLALPFCWKTGDGCNLLSCEEWRGVAFLWFGSYPRSFAVHLPCNKNSEIFTPSFFLPVLFVRSLIT